MPASTISCGGSASRSRPSKRDARARLRLDQPGDRLEQGRLAGAVRAEHHDDLARLHVEVDAGQRRVLAVAGREAADLKHRRLPDRRARLRCRRARSRAGLRRSCAPTFITTQRSHSERIASITCSTMTMVMPLSRSERISAMPSRKLGRIEAGEPFVEQQQVRLERERARELEPLLVDVGELRRRRGRPCRRGRRARAAPARRPRASRAGQRRARETRSPAITFSSTVMDSSTRTSWNVRASAEPRDAERAASGRDRGP